jgi:hypothetical protein
MQRAPPNPRDVDRSLTLWVRTVQVNHTLRLGVEVDRAHSTLHRLVEDVKGVGVVNRKVDSNVSLRMKKGVMAGRCACVGWGEGEKGETQND